MPWRQLPSTNPMWTVRSAVFHDQGGPGAGREGLVRVGNVTPERGVVARRQLDGGVDRARPQRTGADHHVLHELARGSTYADIAANLFVSENTVKTHVSSLYGKLSVNRRSAALAAARSMHLL